MHLGQRKLRLALLVLGICIVLAGAIGILNAIQQSMSLGPQLQYIGTFNVGCAIFCGSGPSQIHYFATDMTAEETTTYFKHASCDKDAVGSDVSADYAGSDYTCTKSGRRFMLTYFSDNPQNVVSDFHLKKTNKHYVVSISNLDYSLAKASL